MSYNVMYIRLYVGMCTCADTHTYKVTNMHGDNVYNKNPDSPSAQHTPSFATMDLYVQDITVVTIHVCDTERITYVPDQSALPHMAHGFPKFTPYMHFTAN